MSVDTCFKNFKTITTAIHNKNPECSGNIVEILLHEVQLPLRRDCMTSLTTCMTSVKLMESFISTKMPLTVPIPPSSTTTRHFHQGKVPYSWRWWSAVPLWMPKQTSIMTVLCMLSHHWAYPMPPRTILCRVWKPPPPPPPPPSINHNSACNLKAHGKDSSHTTHTLLANPLVHFYTQPTYQ